MAADTHPAEKQDASIVNAGTGKTSSTKNKKAKKRKPQAAKKRNKGKSKLAKSNIVSHKIGLLLSDENDWPTALETLARRFLTPITHRGKRHAFELERVRIHPFSLRDPTSYQLVIDRLAWWHTNPREWLKKAALIDDVYLLNNPFTFQSMEKHSAYCATIRMGFNIPETVLLPPKVGPDTEKFRRTASRYHDFFDLSAIGRKLGYPLYMKPFDGGGWRGVSRIDNEEQLLAAYDASGTTVMHLQKGLDDYEVFVRSLGIGPQIISLNYDPSQPMHGRYQIDHDFLSPEKGREAQILTKVINAVFCWDFNSCEAILKDGVLWPIDFANACPDIALTSLHYYFPWAIKALFAWSMFCLAHERPVKITMDLDEYFAIADSDRSYQEKLTAYEALADKHFDTDRFLAFREKKLAGLDEAMWELVGSEAFDRILVDTVRETFPENEQDKFIAHYRGIFSHWRDAEAAHTS